MDVGFVDGGDLDFVHDGVHHGGGNVVGAHDPGRGFHHLFHPGQSLPKLGVVLLFLGQLFHLGGHVRDIGFDLRAHGQEIFIADFVVQIELQQLRPLLLFFFDLDFCFQDFLFHVGGLAHGGNLVDQSFQRRVGFAAELLEHLEQHVHPEGKDVYTALFAIDRVDTLLKYYEYFKKHNDKGYRIAAIFHCQQNEDMEDGCDETTRDKFAAIIDEYNEMFHTSFAPDTFDSYRKDIIKRMKQKNLPQVDLLLVVDMMLTGFDSKPTNLLILDKNLEWHGLLQAYSRTNRVDKVTKRFGQIVTYRNIKQAQDDALKLFSGDGNPNEFLLQSYEYYLAEYRKRVEKLKVICETPDDAGHLIDDDQKREYVFAFRSLASTYATLKTFSKYEQADLDVFLDEADYYDYKSWYLTFYDEMKKDKEKGKENVLVDVDFNIELVRTDKINVVYILNLLKDINRKDKQHMEQSVDLILREIERSDNEKLRYKKEIMTDFIRSSFFDLDPEEDIAKAYEDYEKERMASEIDLFSKENEIPSNIVTDILVEFFANDKAVTKETIRIELHDLDLGLIAMTKRIKAIQMFISEMYNKYTAEGD